MRREEKAVQDRNEIDAIIHGSEICRLAMAVDNLPYLVPLSFGYDGEAVYIHTAPEGRKIEAFLANNRVCLEFERTVRLLLSENGPCGTTFAFESVIAFGTIGEVVERQDKTKGLKLIAEHYHGQLSDWEVETVEGLRLWRIEIETVTGKHAHVDQLVLD